MVVDLTDYTDEELNDLRREVRVEQERRATKERVPEQMERLNRDYLAATGHTEGEEWRQPTGAHNSYPQGWTVEHNGKVWESLTPANVWEPGASGWREVVEDGSDGQPAEWVAPTGSHDSYNTGDLVTFEGQVYRSTIDANTWSPTDYPAGWEVVV